MSTVTDKSKASSKKVTDKFKVGDKVKLKTHAGYDYSINFVTIYEVTWNKVRVEEYPFEFYHHELVPISPLERIL